jgi:hypothetical protein
MPKDTMMPKGKKMSQLIVVAVTNLVNAVEKRNRQPGPLMQLFADLNATATHHLSQYLTFLVLQFCWDL